MENKIAIVSIMVYSAEAVEKVNATLHAYRNDILCRQGIPIKDRGVSVICIIMDAPITEINSLSGKLGMIDGVTSKVLTAK